MKRARPSSGNARSSACRRCSASWTASTVSAATSPTSTQRTALTRPQCIGPNPDTGRLPRHGAGRVRSDARSPRGGGVKRIYGYPGDGINGFFGAMRRAGERFEFVQARHEEMAAFMACAHAKYTGELGVCVSTSGPGAIHMLNGLYDAKLDHQPVLALVGQQSRAALGSSYLQEVDLPALFKDVAHEYVQMATSPE